MFVDLSIFQSSLSCFFKKENRQKRDRDRQPVPKIDRRHMQNFLEKGNIHERKENAHRDDYGADKVYIAEKSHLESRDRFTPRLDQISHLRHRKDGESRSS